MYKLKTFLPDYMYTILQSYLTNRHFRTKYREAHSSLRPVLAGTPQGSVLGPLPYLIYTADLPTLANSTTATVADDTAILTYMRILQRLRTDCSCTLTKFNHGYTNDEWRLMKQNLYRSPLLSKSWYTSGPTSHLAKTYNHKTKALGPQNTKPTLDHWSQLSAIPR
jgi:hypothetical protein